VAFWGLTMYGKLFKMDLSGIKWDKVEQKERQGYDASWTVRSKIRSKK